MIRTIPRRIARIPTIKNVRSYKSDQTLYAVSECKLHFPYYESKKMNSIIKKLNVTDDNLIRDIHNIAIEYERKKMDVLNDALNIVDKKIEDEKSEFNKTTFMMTTGVSISLIYIWLRSDT